MRAVDAALTAPASGAPYQLDGAKLVSRGRWRTFWRTLGVTVFLLALQHPMRQVATGQWTLDPTLGTAAIPVAVPVRLSLLVDLPMIAAYVILAVRSWELVRFGPRRTTPNWVLVWVATVMVVLGAVIDVVEDRHLWVQAEAAQAPGPATLTWEPWTMRMRVLVCLGLLLGFAAAAWAARMVPASSEQLKPSAESLDRPELVVCCSGGGIRAASFCLGGLQALGDRYRRADAVIGVSGGGYIAAAFHVQRWLSKEAGEAKWGQEGQNAYAPGSGEERWLRQHARYLFDSPAAGVFALLSLLFGLAVNLLFITAALGAAAWVAGWLLPTAGGITDWTKYPSTANQYQGDWAWVAWVWVVAAAGVVLFVAASVLDRAVGPFGLAWRDRVRAAVVGLLAVGAALTIALLVLPALLVGLHNFARAEHEGLAKALADMLTTMGFASAGPPAQPDVETTGGASGVAVSGTSLVAIAAAVVAALRALSSSLKSGDGTKETAVGRAAGKVWGKVKGVVIPWVAAVVVVTLLLVLFLTWTVGVLNDPTTLQRWGVAGCYAILVGATFLLTDANRTSLHHYYRERLCSAYLVGRDENGVPQALDYTTTLRYSDSAPPRGHGPELVTCAVANVTDLDVVPTGRACTPFVFTHTQMGMTEEILPSSALAPSADYEFAADSRGRDATIPAAIAISGAAFSPLVGRENVKIRPYRLVLALANARLGVWLPNPLWMDQDKMRHRRQRARDSKRWALVEAVRDMWTKPNPFLVAREAFGRTSVLDRFLYVTDGGHYDNLGLVEALRRQPSTVLVLDASNDDEDSFATLGEAIATARMDLGCEVDIDPRTMRRVKEGRASSGWVHGRVTYRAVGDQAPATGNLWVAKAVMLDGLSWDLETYAGDHADFPRTSTGNQFYGEFDLEAYRALGTAVVNDLLATADRQPTGPLKKV